MSGGWNMTDDMDGAAFYYLTCVQAVISSTQRNALPDIHDDEALYNAPTQRGIHSSNPRGKRRKFRHDNALQCIRRDYLGSNPLYGKEFELMFRLSRPRIELMLQDFGNSGIAYYRSKPSANKSDVPSIDSHQTTSTNSDKLSASSSNNPMQVEGPPSKKRPRVEDGAIVALKDEETDLRTSSLSSPTLQLTGHKGSVYALEYSPNGSALCSASFDKTLLLWSHNNNSSYHSDDDDDAAPTTTGETSTYENYNVLTGHKNAVLDCHWMDNETIVSASADKTVMLWDALTGQRLRKWQSSGSIVNACATLSHQLAAAVADDGVATVWDRRQKACAMQLNDDDTATYPALAVAGTPQQLFCSGIDSNIYCWDLKLQRKSYAMTGHADTVTSLTLHPEATHLLSNSNDATLKMWDIRPFCQSKRQVKEFTGHRHNAEKALLKCAWAPGGNMVAGGSADQMVHVWDEFSTQELYLLPGHKGCVNTVCFHPTENVIASGASDKHVFVGELS